jgi:hypothetical protein
MREAPSAYIFDSDGTVHRHRELPGDDEVLAESKELISA